MEIITSIYNNLLTSLLNPWIEPLWVMILCGLLLIAFFVQLYYLGSRYAGIATYRNNRLTKRELPMPAISVIIPVRENDLYYIENHLELILQQEYASFEVVVVNCSDSEEIADRIEELRADYSHLKTTRIRPDANFRHSTKLVLTVGIKAAANEHLILTNTSCYPVSQKWVALMAKGFQTADIVIGYCGIEPQKGVANLWMRCSRLALSIPFLAEAIHGRTYRGMRGNIGYTRRLYFDNKGFNHLNLNVGDDDLFIQKIAKGEHVSVVMNPAVSLREIQYGGWSWWTSLQRFYTYSSRFYPSRVRRMLGSELWSRVLFYVVAVLLICVLPLWLKVGVAGMVLFRALLLGLKIRRIGKRLGERKVVLVYLFYDLFAPVSECLLYLDRQIRRNNAVWR